MAEKAEKEIAWVFGPSASGKETFINHVTQNTDSPIVKQLGWEGKKLTTCTSSVKHIAQFYRDPVAEKRKQIPAEVKKLLDTADVVLIKWQEVDAKANLPQQLYKQFPNERHSIIHLQVDRAELSRRLQRKPWWDAGENTKEFIDDELLYIDSEIAKLSQIFEVMEIDTNGNGYSIN